MYIYIYVLYVLLVLHYTYIYIYIYNPHLGLINVPPLLFVPLKTTFVTIHLLSKRPDIY